MIYWFIVFVGRLFLLKISLRSLVMYLTIYNKIIFAIRKVDYNLRLQSRFDNHSYVLTSNNNH